MKRYLWRWVRGILLITIIAVWMGVCEGIGGWVSGLTYAPVAWLVFAHIDAKDREAKTRKILGEVQAGLVETAEGMRQRQADRERRAHEAVERRWHQ